MRLNVNLRSVLKLSKAPLLAISAGWKCIVPVSMIMGTLGAAVGNYLGIMCSLAMRAIIGG